MSILILVIIPIYPIIYYMIFNEIILIFPIEIPYIDWKSSLFGYSLNYFYHILLLVYYVFITVLSNLYIVNVIICAIAKYDVIKVLLHEIDNLLKKNEQNSKKIHQNMRLLIEMQNKLSNFINLIQDTFSYYLFLEFATMMFEIVVALFVMINVSVKVRFL